MSVVPPKSKQRAGPVSQGVAARRTNAAESPVPWDEISRLHRPPTLRFRKLIAELERAYQAGEAGDDELYVILKYVVSIIHFLDADLAIRGSGITRHLGVLAAALRDLGQGARPPLFFDRPKQGPGRPKDISFEAARGAIAAAVGMLVDWNEPRDEAGQFVAEQVRQAGLKAPRGKAIQTRQVLRWRDEIGGGASALAESTYKDIRTKYASVPPEVAADPKRRREIVAGAIRGIRSMGLGF